MRVLIVEDEKRLADALGQIMEQAHYVVDVVYDGKDGLAYAQMGQYDVILLDVMLPGMDGFSIVRQLRGEKNATPILMLTARDAVGSKVAGLDSGADDYMTKPFSPDELLARVRAVSRRQGEVVTSACTFGDLTLQLSARELCCGKRSVRLGFKEFEVMRLLMLDPNTVTAKESLILNIWGAESDAEDNNVEAYISFLRKKLAFLGSKVSIGTIRKVGYRLELPV